MGARWSVAVVSIWFGLVHVPQLAGDWVGVPVILAMSFIWTLQRQIYQSLVPSMVCHWIYNVCVVGFSLALST
jgi:membrane protease YdiL (CAAX protease family)